MNIYSMIILHKNFGKDWAVLHILLESVLKQTLRPWLKRTECRVRADCFVRQDAPAREPSDGLSAKMPGFRRDPMSPDGVFLCFKLPVRSGLSVKLPPGGVVPVRCEAHEVDMYACSLSWPACRKHMPALSKQKRRPPATIQHKRCTTGVTVERLTRFQCMKKLSGL